MVGSGVFSKSNISYKHDCVDGFGQIQAMCLLGGGWVIIYGFISVHEMANVLIRFESHIIIKTIFFVLHLHHHRIANIHYYN